MTPDDTPLHRLRDGTTGTTLEALAEAQREIEALSAPPITRADFLARLAAMMQAYERANEGVILGVNVEFSETDAVGWDGETMGPCDPLHVTVAAATDARVEARDARIADLEREKAALEGLRPELPPFPPDGRGLPRYGLRWNGPATPLAVPMDDGYWTPWHLVVEAEKHRDARIAALEAGLADALEALADMTGFVEAAHYAEKYGIAETMARLRKLLPESAVAPENDGRNKDAAAAARGGK